MSGRDLGGDCAKRTQSVVRGLDLTNQSWETNPIGGGSASVCVLLRRAKGRGLACYEEKK